MDDELNFSWPEPARPEEIDPFEETAEGRPAFLDDPPDVAELKQQLEEAKRTIARLEADRRTARLRIEELEEAERRAEEMVVSQRRRLVLLERRLEDLPVGMDLVPQRASWLDRLLGGVGSATDKATSTAAADA